MTNCIHNGDGLYCVYCGWKRPANYKSWPRRPCSCPPDIVQAAVKIGITMNDVSRWNLAQQLAAWMAMGCPELSQEEVNIRDNICTMQCEHKRPLGIGGTWGGTTCSSKGRGCGTSGPRPPLWIMQRLPEFRCPDNKWPLIIIAAKNPEQR